MDATFERPGRKLPVSGTRKAHPKLFWLLAAGVLPVVNPPLFVGLVSVLAPGGDLGRVFIAVALLATELVALGALARRNWPEAKDRTKRVLPAGILLVVLSVAWAAAEAIALLLIACSGGACN